MTTQPEPLRLADWMNSFRHDEMQRAAAELRRLHADVEELRGALDEAMWHVKYKELKAVNESDTALLRWCLKVLEFEDLACRHEKEPTPEHIAKVITALRERLEVKA